jgi:acyl carrier protein phosphodiesterase
MNFLAHAYLSFSEPEILTGNMISDFVKGKKKFDYPIIVQKGIELHRFIDDFTDHHPATKQAKGFFKKDYRLYSGAFVDVVYDHFLAIDKDEFADDVALKNFTSKTYSSLQNNSTIFPEHFSQVFNYMKKDDWLYNYRFVQGIEKSFGGLVRRAAYLTDSATAGRVFAQHYLSLQDCYSAFFKDLKKMANERFLQLIKN